MKVAIRLLTILFVHFLFSLGGFAYSAHKPPAQRLVRTLS